MTPKSPQFLSKDSPDAAPLKDAGAGQAPVKGKAPEHDRALVKRMLSGDERAFDEFFETYFPGLYRFAIYRVDNDPLAAEEITQAALCGAMTKIASYRGEAPLFSWLCTFCRHEISAWYERQQRAPAPV